MYFWYYVYDHFHPVWKVTNYISTEFKNLLPMKFYMHRRHNFWKFKNIICAKSFEREIHMDSATLVPMCIPPLNHRSSLMGLLSWPNKTQPLNKGPQQDMLKIVLGLFLLINYPNMGSHPHFFRNQGMQSPAWTFHYSKKVPDNTIHSCKSHRN
jgi:hypothetical protein